MASNIANPHVSLTQEQFNFLSNDFRKEMESFKKMQQIQFDNFIKKLNFQSQNTRNPLRIQRVSFNEHVKNLAKKIFDFIKKLFTIDFWKQTFKKS